VSRKIIAQYIDIFSPITLEAMGKIHNQVFETIETWGIEKCNPTKNRKYRLKKWPICCIQHIVNAHGFRNISQIMAQHP